jgi:hypothetical protein
LAKQRSKHLIQKKGESQGRSEASTCLGGLIVGSWIGETWDAGNYATRYPQPFSGKTAAILDKKSASSRSFPKDCDRSLQTLSVHQRL